MASRSARRTRCSSRSRGTPCRARTRSSRRCWRRSAAPSQAWGAGRWSRCRFSAAMHSLLGLVPGRRPAHDRRHVGRHARRASRPDGCGRRPAGWRCTAGPARRCTPCRRLPKLLWFREQEPQLFERVGHWVGIKEYVLLRLCDALVVDHSVASATGLLNLAALEWDAEALHLARARGRAAGRAGAHHHGAAGADRRGGRADRAAGADARRRRRGRRAAREPGSRRGGPGRRRLLDRHQRGAARHGRPAGGRPARPGVLLRPHGRPVGRGRGHQQRRCRPGVGR